jgi:nucleoside-diphosphate-sugar epimerase
MHDARLDDQKVVSDEPRLVAVTGATGYIGAALCRALSTNRHPVLGLSRTVPRVVGVRHLPYDLRAELAPDALMAVFAVIHLATETDRGASTDVEAELQAVRRLLAAAQLAGTRFVFVSSQTARADAPTDYGRAKWLIEQEVLANGGAVIRPGFVYGGQEKGLFGALCRVIRRFRIIPILLPAPQVQLIHVDDLSHALIAAAFKTDFKPEVFCIAEPHSMPFHDFLGAIAAHRIDRSALRIPIPLPVLLPLLTVLSWIVGAAADPGRLRSLAALPSMATEASLSALALRPRSMAFGLSRSGQSIRLQLIEARTLLRYVLGISPGLGIIRRYVQAMTTMNEPHPLRFSRYVRALPQLIAGFDQAPIRVGVPGSALFERIGLAVAVAEASPQHADRFIARDNGTTAIVRLARLGGRLCFEGVVKVVTAPLRALLIRRLPSRME